MSITSLWNLLEHKWNKNALNAIYDIESVEAILHMKWPWTTITDTLRWLKNNKGVFLAKRYYKFLLANNVGVFDPI